MTWCRNIYWSLAVLLVIVAMVAGATMPVGPDITDRPMMDLVKGVYRFPWTLRIRNNGSVSKWRYFARTRHQVYLFIMRRVSPVSDRKPLTEHMLVFIINATRNRYWHQSYQSQRWLYYDFFTSAQWQYFVLRQDLRYSTKMNINATQSTMK